MRNELVERDHARCAGDVERLVYVSNLVGRDPRLVQPGGGNTSLKVREKNAFGEEEDVLLVKGSGTDLRTIGADGFARLSLARLAGLRARVAMGDAELLAFLRLCALAPGRDPSVETPLHSILPHRAIVHTHDVPTMSLTDLGSDDAARRGLHEVFGDELFFVEYARPGFPLARLVADRAREIPPAARGMVLARHGLVVWGRDCREAYETLLDVQNRMEERLARPVRVAPGAAAERARPVAPETLLPVLRGCLGGGVLRLDTGEDVRRFLASERLLEAASRGVATPEHVLRAGKAPLVLRLDAAHDVAAQVRARFAAARAEYVAYHERNAPRPEEPLPDWLKVVLVPGLGMVTAGGDAKSAATAAACYRAVMQVVENAEALDRFAFLGEKETWEFEHWELERRKVREAPAPLAGKVAFVVGGGSGIGEATARLFAAEGAHVAVADLRADGARRVAQDLAGRGVGLALDVASDAAVREAVDACVREFGGLDVVVYSPGLSPAFEGVLELTEENVRSQMEVHYLGAVRVTKHAGAVLEKQGLGGRLLYVSSKAAFAVGREASAYGASKAALTHFARNVANELGPLGVTANCLTAHMVDTPLFRAFVAARAARKGKSADETLREYAQATMLRRGLVPPEAVARAALFLAGDGGAYTTAGVLTVDGGLADAYPR
jgi:rhamnose utilization protein RhaD (predicted bifunctional aldolase and dehydrogenase)/NAD(P)-dependent dehydrogenase (short-subunit alcohol dehydrogenase family)